jgi:inositol-phosphate transport system substrate-binding protein
MEYPAYLDSEFLADVTYMLDSNYYQPNHVQYGLWFDIVWSGMLAAEQGEKSPEKAAEDTIKLLKMELGDSIIVK